MFGRSGTGREIGGCAVKLIIGGHGQGKLDYVREKYKIRHDEISYELGENQVVYSLHIIVKKLIEEGEDPVSVVLRHAENHPGTIYICDEVGSGVVPIDPFERQWRESVGRVCTALAGRAEEVERIFCGLSMTLRKSDLPD